MKKLSGYTPIVENIDMKRVNAIVDFINTKTPSRIFSYINDINIIDLQGKMTAKLQPNGLVIYIDKNEFTIPTQVLNTLTVKSGKYEYRVSGLLKNSVFKTYIRL